MISSTNF